MDATAHFYDYDTDLALQTKNAKGGSTFTLFDSVSELLAYAKDKAIDIINVVTHNDC